MVNYGPASKYYDLFGSKSDINFYREFAVKHGKKALELGVGTGRVAIELAKAGVTVWGIDNSPFMLTVANQKLRKESLIIRNRVKLKLGDMRNFKLEEVFSFIYIPSSTFEHCVTEEDQIGCLTCARDALQKEGMLVFDISQSDRKPDNSWWIDRKETNAEEEVVRTIFSRRNPKTNVVSLNLFFEVYRRGALKEKYHEYGEAKISSKEETERLLEDVGLKVVKTYGDFDKSDYSPESQRVIFVCTKP
jgi:cyclopropane fatty-acyl-phospholipid synthase-like methyltransferase